MRYHADCEIVYTGQTLRRTKAQIEEHINKKQTTPPILQHVLKKHKVGSQNTKIIIVEEHLNKRPIREAIVIEKTENVKTRNGSINLSDS